MPLPSWVPNRLERRRMGIVGKPRKSAPAQQPLTRKHPPGNLAVEEHDPKCQGQCLLNLHADKNTLIPLCREPMEEIVKLRNDLELLNGKQKRFAQNRVRAELRRRRTLRLEEASDG